MQAGNPHLARVHGLQDAGQQADAGAVAQLGVVEAQVADFAQHGAAIGVPVRIPAGGKGIHGEERRVGAWSVEHGRRRAPGGVSFPLLRHSGA